MGSLAGRVALVTGGSRGIGAAIARRLAAEGADVAVTGRAAGPALRGVVAAVEGQGRRALAIAADAADAQAVQDAVDRTVAAFGRLDILVNNAGIFPVGSIEQASIAEFDSSLAVNLRAAFVAAKAAVPHMRDGGRIISIGSNLAERVPSAGLAAYAASKAGLIGLTRALARDLGPRGITVNIVHPGSTDTDMNPADGPDADDQRALMAIPRFGDPDDLAGLVAWLAGPQARSVTGAGFTVDGGANA